MGTADRASVDVQTAAAGRYALSFTTGGLMAREGVLLAPVYVDLREWEAVRDCAQGGNLLQARTYSSSVPEPVKLGETLGVVN